MIYVAPFLLQFKDWRLRGTPPRTAKPQIEPIYTLSTLPSDGSAARVNKQINDDSEVRTLFEIIHA